MREFRIEWAVVPGAHNPPRVSFVEAEEAMDASKILQDHIERKEGVRIVVRDITVYNRPTGGRVLL
jgi:hypothetical protein